MPASRTPYARTERVGTEIAHALAGLIERECADPRLRLVTVTDVHMSPDLKQARVMVASADPEASGEEALAALRHAGTRLRRALASAVRLRVVPRLNFYWDDRGERYSKLETLIERGLPRDGGERS